MSWILLLIQIVPAIIQLVQFIRELIGQLPRDERSTAKAELVSLARRHVRKHRRDARSLGTVAFGASSFSLAHGADKLRVELEQMRALLAVRVAAAAKPTT